MKTGVWSSNGVYGVIASPLQVQEWFKAASGLEQQLQRGNIQNPIFLPCHDNPFFLPLSPDLEAQSKP